MRNAFAKALHEQALKDPSIVLLSGDIGNRLFDQLKRDRPSQFMNCGVAEANMVSMAAGMAARGLRPICYTITPFLVSRAYEQIKVDVAYHRVPVVLVGTGSGYAYASLGPTHHSPEDISLMATLPGMRILVPSGPGQVAGALKNALISRAPAFIRIGKKGEMDIPGSKASVEWHCVSKSGDAQPVSILACGPIVAEAVAAATQFQDVDVYDCPRVSPLPHPSLMRIAGNSRLILTLEEGCAVGGFGAAVMQAIPKGLCPFMSLNNAGSHSFISAHSQKEAWNIAGISSSSISNQLRNLDAGPAELTACLHPSKRISVDLDNTIANYDQAARHAAEKFELKAGGGIKNVSQLREAAFSAGGNRLWTQVQSWLYGKGMEYARPHEGALEMIQAALADGWELRVFSHRTKVAKADRKVDLHQAAQSWARKNLPPTVEVVLCESREMKVAQITAWKPVAHLDDHPAVAADVAALNVPSYHFTETSEVVAPGARGVQSWWEFGKALGCL